VAALAAAAGLSIPLVAPAGATAGPTTPTSSQIKQARAKMASLTSQISADGEREQIAGERYDQANAELAAEKARLVTLLGKIHRQTTVVNSQKVLVGKAAVEAYVYGATAAAQFGAAISSSIPDAGALTTYAGLATRNLHDALVKLQAVEQRLRTFESNQRAAIRASSAAEAEAAAAKASAASAVDSAQSALRDLRGHLAALIAQQAEQEALARAAAARAAATAAARDKDAQDAASAYQLAADLASLDPAAAAAAERAANEAALASEEGHPILEPAGSSVEGNTAVATAERFLGVPYVWGGASASGFDCSGLTMYAWGAAGIALTHSAWYQFRETTPVPLSQIEPGDLLFYSFPNDGPDPVTHVAMYVGSGPFGGETIIQAPETGETVSYSPMYYYGFVGAGRPS
jgi:peptidoglycan DL-endopeptidase CwlO